MLSGASRKGAEATSGRSFMATVGVTVASLGASDLLLGWPALAAKTLKGGEQVSEGNPNVRAVLDVFKP
jgi:hypothetical protein